MGTQTAGRRSRKRKAISPEEAAIGRRLKEIRLRRGKTQAQVAAAVGITQPALSECESREVRLHGNRRSVLSILDALLDKQGRNGRS